MPLPNFEDDTQYEEEMNKFNFTSEEGDSQMDEINRIYRKDNKNDSSMLPTFSDPSLWIVKWKITKEYLCALSLMNKVFELKRRGQQTNILSVTVSDEVEGVLYIEAFKEKHVKEGIKGMRDIYQSKISQVPRKEMHKVYEMDDASKVLIKKGMFVRVKCGLYSGDLAKVEYVKERSKGIIWRLIPRIKTENDAEDSKSNNRQTNRPKKQLFSRSLITSEESTLWFHEIIGK